jgi:transposase
MPWCDTHAMNEHLAEIARHVARNAHAVLIPDQAGWHLTDKLAVPDTITLLPLPPTSPELNPMENIWQFMRDNWLSNSIFDTCEDIIEHSCLAWLKRVADPWNIASIGLRDGTHRY